MCDWSSVVCSSDLPIIVIEPVNPSRRAPSATRAPARDAPTMTSREMVLSSFTSDMSVSLPLGCALLDEGSSALLEVLGADHAAHRTIADRPRLLVPVGAEDRNAMHGLLGLPNRDRGVGGDPLRDRKSVV